jgi:hypothetical protein
MKKRMLALGAAMLTAMTLLSGCGGSGSPAPAAAAPKPQLNGTYVFKDVPRQIKLTLKDGVDKFVEGDYVDSGTYTLSDKPGRNGLYTITTLNGDTNACITSKPSTCRKGAENTIFINQFSVKASGDGKQLVLTPDFDQARAKSFLAPRQGFMAAPFKNCDYDMTKGALEDPDCGTLIRQ